MLSKKRMGCYLLGLAIVSPNLSAVTYTYPGNATAPLVMTGSDALTVTSGTMQTSSSSSTGYTVDISGNASPSTNAITINSGATLSYQGTNGGAATINSARTSSNNPAATSSINLTANSILSSGTGLYAIYLRNTDGTPNDAHTITINSGTVNGTILTNNVNSSTLNLIGTPTINGTISLQAQNNNSTLNVGDATTATTLTLTNTLTNIGLLQVKNNATLNLNALNTNIEEVQIDAGGILNLNYPMVGLTSSDGIITNNGQLNIYANISKTSTFSGSGTNVIYQGAANGLTISTSSYSIANHTAVMTDLLNYGNITLAANFTATNFSVSNGGGYFPAGDYTLVTSPSITPPSFATPPANTLFLTFGNPFINGNKIKITLTRTPFNTFATNSLTQAIASNLENIGSSSSLPSASMMTLLDAVEASTTPNQVELALRQLAPLANAPFYGYDIQNNNMYQVQLRLAALHDSCSSYFAGDIAKENNIWARPFGSYGNQQPKDDSLGYYATSGGIVAGFDRNLGDRYSIGAAFGYTVSHVEDKVNTQSVTSLKSYTAMMYGTYDVKNTSYLDWILAITANEFNANRIISINNQYSQVATSSYGSQQVATRGLWSKDYPAFGFMQLTPQGMVQYTFVKQYTYTESGAPGANLTISRENSNVITLGLGGKAAIPIMVDPSIVMPEVHALAYYNPVAGRQNTIFNFVDGGSSMYSVMNLSRTGLRVGAALTVAIVGKLEAKLNFDYDVADRFNGYTGYLNLRYML